MSNEPATVKPIDRPVLRVSLGGDGAAYEVFLDSSHNLIGLRLHDVTGEDALVHFSPAEMVQFRAHLGATVVDAAPIPGARSAAGRAIAEMLRAAFIAIIELEKSAPHEADELYRSVVSQVRSAKPYVMRSVAT